MYEIWSILGKNKIIDVIKNDCPKKFLCECMVCWSIIEKWYNQLYSWCRNCKPLSRKIIKYENYIELELTWWEYTKIDLDDYEKIKYYCWYKSIRGSVESRFKKKLKKLHRFIMDAKEWEIVDHINWDTLDNRKSNLRICSIMQNAWNSKMYCSNTSWIKNIRFNVKLNRWLVEITTNYKKKMKSFIFKEDAIKFLELLKKERWEYNRI